MDWFNQTLTACGVCINTHLFILDLMSDNHECVFRCFLSQINPDDGSNIASLACSSSCRVVFPSFYATCFATSPKFSYDLDVYNLNQRCLIQPELSPNYCATNNCGQCTQINKLAVIAACNVCDCADILFYAVCYIYYLSYSIGMPKIIYSSLGSGCSSHIRLSQPSHTLHWCSVSMNHSV